MRPGNVLRWVRVLGLPVGGPLHAPARRPDGTVGRVTAADVLAYLRGCCEVQERYPSQTLERLGEILAALPQYMAELRGQRDVRGLERYVERLPLIVTLYCRGYSCRDIAGRLGAMSTDYGVNETLSALARFVAGRLNNDAVKPAMAGR
jgi:hypothetical protein